MINNTELFTLFNNNSNITYDTIDETIPDLLRTTVVGTISSLLVVSILVGNLLVIIAVATTPSLQNNTNYLIVNLACADLCLGLFAVPLSTLVYVYDSHWPFGYTLCDVWHVIDILLTSASILTSGAVGIDRYISLTKPLHYNTIVTAKRLAVVILAVWILSFGIAFPAMQWKRSHKNPDLCRSNNDMSFVIYSVTASFYVPTTIVVAIYIKIYRIAKMKQESRIAQYMRKELNERCQSSKVNAWEENILTKQKYVSPVGKIVRKGPQSAVYHVSKHYDVTVNNNQMKSALLLKVENKALRTVGKVIGVFIVCWFPFFFLMPLDTICPQCNIPKMAIDVGFWLGYFNSMMNPIIYAFSSKRYKEAFLRLLRSCGKRQTIRLYT